MVHALTYFQDFNERHDIQQYDRTIVLPEDGADMELNYEGLISIFGGVYLLLIVHGKVAVSKDPVKFEAWRRRWKPTINWLAPAVILFGLLELFRVL